MQISETLRTTPADLNVRLLLFAMRRMAVGGLKDAFAANALLGSFGGAYRRPLLLLRAFMAELARISQRQIGIGPGCCPCMTPAEAQLILILGAAIDRPRFAASRLTDLLGVHECLGALSSAQAVAQCFADLGRPLLAQSEWAEPAFPID